MMSGGSGVGGVSQSATWSDAFSEARQGFCAQILSCIQRAMSADRGLLGQMSEQYMQKVSARELAKIMRDERPAADVWLEAVCGSVDESSRALRRRWGDPRGAVRIHEGAVLEKLYSVRQTSVDEYKAWAERSSRAGCQPARHIALMKQIFIAMDTDASGTMSADELREGLQLHGVHVSPADMQALAEFIKREGLGGELSLGQWIEFAAPQGQMEDARGDIKSRMRNATQELEKDFADSHAALDVRATELRAGIVDCQARTQRAEAALVLAESVLCEAVEKQARSNEQLKAEERGLEEEMDEARRQQLASAKYLSTLGEKVEAAEVEITRGEREIKQAWRGVSFAARMQQNAQDLQEVRTLSGRVKQSQGTTPGSQTSPFPSSASAPLPSPEESDTTMFVPVSPADSGYVVATPSSSGQNDLEGPAQLALPPPREQQQQPSVDSEGLRRTPDHPVDSAKASWRLRTSEHPNEFGEGDHSAPLARLPLDKQHTIGVVVDESLCATERSGLPLMSRSHKSDVGRVGSHNDVRPPSELCSKDAYAAAGVQVATVVSPPVEHAPYRTAMTGDEPPSVQVVRSSGPATLPDAAPSAVAMSEGLESDTAETHTSVHNTGGRVAEVSVETRAESCPDASRCNDDANIDDDGGGGSDDDNDDDASIDTACTVSLVAGPVCRPVSVTPPRMSAPAGYRAGRWRRRMKPRMLRSDPGPDAMSLSSVPASQVHNSTVVTESTRIDRSPRQIFIGANAEHLWVTCPQAPGQNHSHLQRSRTRPHTAGSQRTRTTAHSPRSRTRPHTAGSRRLCIVGHDAAVAAVVRSRTTFATGQSVSPAPSIMLVDPRTGPSRGRRGPRIQLPSRGSCLAGADKCNRMSWLRGAIFRQPVWPERSTPMTATHRASGSSDGRQMDVLFSGLFPSEVPLPLCPRGLA